jgi:flagellar basal-body rod modification protein FlgD
MAAINPTSATTSSGVANTPGVSAQPDPLGKDACMQLLITQLEHQDPTQPMDDSAFLAQLAQFSSLEKLTTISDSLTSINGLLSTASGSIPAGSSTSSSASATTSSTTPATSTTPDTSSPTQSMAATKGQN